MNDRNEMEMQRETRYVVLKLKDIDAFLNAEERLKLHSICEKIRIGRSVTGRRRLDCIVVESDWPEYGSTLAAIELRVLQEQCEHEWKWHQMAGEGQICRKCFARNFDCDD